MPALDLRITNLNTKSVRKLTFSENGKIECDNGTITWKYVKGKQTSYRKIIFTNGKFQQYDSKGKKIGGVYNKPSYDFQNLLNLAKSGGTLTVHFYHGTFRLYGPYRIFGNTTLRAPQDNDVYFEKYSNIYTFINTDDSAAKSYSFSKGLYEGSGNITLENLDINARGYNPEIGKFIHAKNINVFRCKVRNGRYNFHVFEFCCVQNARVQGCTFEDLLGQIGNVTSGNHEVIQVESALKGGFPYCQYSRYSYSYRCDGVLISSCIFKNVMRGIGTHAASTDSQNYQKNIRIYNCTFQGIKEYAVNFECRTAPYIKQLKCK